MTPDLAVKLKGKVVIRFDGPPAHESGRFIEVERDGASINFGEWVQDDECWLLVIEPEPAKCINPDRPFTPRVRELLGRADNLALQRKVDYVDTLHLLMALLNQCEFYATQVIMNAAGPDAVTAMQKEAKLLADGFEGKLKHAELET